MVKYSRKHCKKGRNKSRRMRGGVETPEAAETAADGFFSAFSTAKAAALQEEAAAAVKAETAALQAEAEKTTNDVTNFATNAKTNLSTQFSDVTGVNVNDISLNPFSSKNEVAPAPVPVLSIPGSGTETGTAPVQEATETAGGEVEKSWFSSFWKGGKHGSNHMRGGQKLGLNYYATPVHGIKMADPTYMEYYKGGKRSTSKRSTRKRSTRKRRSCKRRKCRKTCNKRHRHCRK